MNKRFFKKKRVKVSDEDRQLIQLEIDKLTNSIDVLRSSGTDQAIIDSLLTQKKKLEFKLEGTINKFNAVRTSYNDEWYDSSMEAEFAKHLDREGIKWKRQVKFQLIPPFKLTYESVKELSLRVDFIINDYVIVDVKGMVTADWEIRWKVLKSMCQNRYVYFIVKKKTEFDGVIKFAKLNSYQIHFVPAPDVIQMQSNPELIPFPEEDTHDYHQDDFESDHESGMDNEIDF